MRVLEQKKSANKPKHLRIKFSIGKRKKVKSSCETKCPVERNECKMLCVLFLRQRLWKLKRRRNRLISRVVHDH